VLSDTDKKAKYDRYGHAAFAPGSGGFSGSANVNMEDIFSQFGDIFGDDIFGNFFGGGRRSSGGGRSRGTRGSNLRVKLKLNYEEIAKGVTKTLRLRNTLTAIRAAATVPRTRTVFKPVLPAVAAGR
jgi:molecular chaperone DnaJ